MAVCGLYTLYMGLYVPIWTVCALYIDSMPPRDLYMDCIGFVWSLHGPYMAINGMYGLCELFMDSIRTVCGCIMIDRMALVEIKFQIFRRLFLWRHRSTGFNCGVTAHV